MEIEFNSLQELYQRLEPALTVKESEFSRCDLEITKKDIWEYLAHAKWSISSNLLLHQMVSDIMHLRANEILEYLSK